MKSTSPPLRAFEVVPPSTLRRPGRWLRCLLTCIAVVALCAMSPAALAQSDDASTTPEDVAGQVQEVADDAADAMKGESEGSSEGDADAEAAAEAARFQADLDAAGVTAGVYRANNLWILIAAALVFIMHLGFCSVEAGMCRAKNAVNILTKNVWIICTGILLYWVWGFNAMYPGDAWRLGGEWFAFGSPLDPTAPNAMRPTYFGGAYTIYTDFIFQAMFAATAATIVSGAVAERIKLLPFMIYAVVLVGFAYPFTGGWKWGAGWLDDMGFYDLAGSTVVHAFGGFAALAGVLLLGPRLGKYGSNGEVRAIPGHNLPLANVGVFLLFLGWFGFNGGSVLSADEAGVSTVFVTTALAGCAGGMIALLVSMVAFGGKPDLTMGLNGMLAGLVGITAGADVISPGWSIVVGGIAGALVFASVLAFDRVRIDDPVGAISVHGVCGVWGTLAVGIFSSNGDHSFLTQLIGTFAISVTAFLISLTIFAILKVLGGIRVSETEEIEGLDLGEHGMRAYHGLGGDATTA